MFTLGTLLDLPSLDAFRAFQKLFLRWETLKNHEWYSSSMKRTCFSTKRQRSFCKDRTGRKAYKIKGKSESISSPRAPGTSPDTILSQLGNRVQHALRAYSPAEQKVVRAAAGNFSGPTRPSKQRGNNTTRHRRGSGLFPCRRRGNPGIVERAHPSAAESDGNSR